MHMPVMDGLEASAKILELQTGIPIVAMTANVMPNDKELYKTNGILDCVSKPFTSQELWRCLMKYFKPVGYKSGAEAVSAGIDPKLLNDFVKSHRNTYTDIRKALNEGDIKLAHRLAHTLKSTAGMVNRTELQEIAFNVEKALTDGDIGTVDELMGDLERALGDALADLEPLSDGFRSITGQQPLAPPPKTLDAEQARELLEKLESLLKTGNLECLEMINDLYMIEGCVTLIEQIENFDFEPAQKTLAEIKRTLGA